MSAHADPAAPAAQAAALERAAAASAATAPDAPAPLPSASVLLLRDGSAGLEVLLLRRHAQARAWGGAYVFPGGKLDAADCAPERLRVLDQPQADFALGLNESSSPPALARGLYVAALRELYEEADILLGVPGAAASASALPDCACRWQQALHARGWLAHTAAVRPWARWITPLQPLLSPLRFDTRFFLALLPPQQTVRPDGRETVAALWLTPLQALQRHWAQELDLIAPQLMSLAELARYPSAAALWQQAQTRRAPCIAPEPFQDGALRGLCYPGDPCHSQPGPLLPGPTRLRLLGRRFEPCDGFAGWWP